MLQCVAKAPRDKSPVPAGAASGILLRLLSSTAQEKQTRKSSDVIPGGKLMTRCAKHSIWTRFIGTHLIGKLGLSGLILALVTVSAVAQKKYDTGVTDTEIKIGNIMPYSGPASAYGIIGKTEQAFFNKINAAGGING